MISRFIRNNLKYIILILLAISAVFLTYKIIKNYQVSKNNEQSEIKSSMENTNDYGILIPYKKGGSVSFLENSNTNFDLNSLQDGLFRISEKFFSKTDHFFEEGQLIKESDMKYLLARQNEKRKDLDNKKLKNSGINPDKNKSVNVGTKAIKKATYVNYIYEQNFLKSNIKGKYEIKGVSIGLVMNTKEKDQFYTNDQLKNNASEVIKGLKNYLITNNKINGSTPIIFAIYKDSESLISSEYISYAKTTPADKDELKWNDIDQKNVTFLSEDLRKISSDDYNKFETMQTEINKFSKNFIAVSGKGYFENKKLENLKITVRFSSNNDSEISGLISYIGKQAERFFKSTNITITINNDTKPVGFISKLKNKTIRKYRL